ncbi:MAG: hypothetical protein A2Y63_00305 [Candidatus Riflebacteria bacterium RBG_13_59_9]|nr:MAG: hypothetical protein A2Y63_00305 [Candidatus Riflebacteria bacterium RBG_13_59_9]
MGSLNKVMLIGNVGQDPDVRYSTSGKPVARFSLATNERWTSRGSNEPQEHTEWHNIVSFGSLAERVKEYVTKGRQVFVEGRLRANSWTDVNGIKHTRTEIHARDIQFLGSRRDAGTAPEVDKQAKGDEDTIDLGVNDDFSVSDLGPAVEMDDLSLTPD